MFCPKCGNNNKDEAKFCTVCGTALSQAQANNNNSAQQANKEEAQPQAAAPEVQQNINNAAPVQQAAPNVQPNTGYTAPRPQTAPNIQYVNPQQQAPVQKVSNFMVFSIINTIAWFIICNPIALVLGIIAIVKSSSVDKLSQTGNHEGALAAAKSAKILNIIALIIGVVGGFAMVLFYIIAILGSMG